ncbi:MAG: hypothetical protein FWE85_06375, partial [Clostridiales bacterium]|nr:hypothetical protein [Clostridiales bacterium]
HPKAKAVPIIAMTANVFREDIKQCLEAGMNDHIGKPLDYDEVIRQLQWHILYRKSDSERRRKDRRWLSDRRQVQDRRQSSNRRQTPDRRQNDRRKHEE